MVIESAQYQISVSEPVWRMSPEEEARQHEANAKAMQSFMDRVMGTPDAREEAAYDGTPKDEFEWELFLRASDRRVTKLGELMEKYHDSPDRDRLIARAMGWTEIAEMLEAEAESGTEAEPENTSCPTTLPRQVRRPPDEARKCQQTRKRRRSASTRCNIP